MKLRRERRKDKFTIDLQTLRNTCTFQTTTGKNEKSFALLEKYYMRC